MLRILHECVQVGIFFELKKLMAWEGARKGLTSSPGPSSPRGMSEWAGDHVAMARKTGLNKSIFKGDWSGFCLTSSSLNTRIERCSLGVMHAPFLRTLPNTATTAAVSAYGDQFPKYHAVTGIIVKSHLLLLLRLSPTENAPHGLRHSLQKQFKHRRRDHCYGASLPTFLQQFPCHIIDSTPFVCLLWSYLSCLSVL